MELSVHFSVQGTVSDSTQFKMRRCGSWALTVHVLQPYKPTEKAKFSTRRSLCIVGNNFMSLDFAELLKTTLQRQIHLCTSLPKLPETTQVNERDRQACGLNHVPSVSEHKPLKLICNRYSRPTVSSIDGQNAGRWFFPAD